VSEPTTGELLSLIDRLVSFIGTIYGLPGYPFVTRDIGLFRDPVIAAAMERGRTVPLTSETLADLFDAIASGNRRVK